MNLKEEARDLHYKLIEDYHLSNSPTDNAEIRALIVGVITIIIGLAVFHFGGKTKFGSVLKVIGAGVTIAGILPIVSGLTGMLGGKLGLTTSA